jgi:hypothetical protein
LPLLERRIAPIRDLISGVCVIEDSPSAHFRRLESRYSHRAGPQTHLKRKSAPLR